MKQFLPLGFLLLLLAGCSKSTVPGPTDAEKGSIRFDCSISAQVATVQEGGTKADPATRELPASCIPDISQMKLHLTGSTTSTEYHYENMAAYDQPLLDPDDYTAHFTYGDSEAEGPQAAYFEGTTTCTVAARKTVTQSVTHSLSNSLYTLEFADWFKSTTPHARFRSRPVQAIRAPIRSPRKPNLYRSSLNPIQRYTSAVQL